MKVSKQDATFAFLYMCTNEEINGYAIQERIDDIVVELEAPSEEYIRKERKRILTKKKNSQKRKRKE